MKKVKDLHKKLIELKKERDIISKKNSELVDKCWRVERQIESCIFEQKLYIPIENLKQYEDETALKEITLISDNGCFTKFKYMGILEIQDGHLYCSDYNEGIYEFNEKKNKYFWHRYGIVEEGENIVGYVNCDLEKDSYIEQIINHCEVTND